MDGIDEIFNVAGDVALASSMGSSGSGSNRRGGDCGPIAIVVLIVAVVLIVPMTIFGIKNSRHKDDMRFLKEECAKSLKIDADISGVYKDDEYTIIYTKTDKEELAQAYWREEYMEKRDINKSRAVGSWVRKKGGEFVKGLISGDGD